MPLNFSTIDAEVSAVLAQFPVSAPIHRVNPLANHGGLSGASIWKVETTDAALALRRWPAEHPTSERLRFIHAVLAHVYAKGLRIVPVPISTLAGETFVSIGGRLWELAPWLPGESSFEYDPSRARIGAAMRAVATFHLASASPGAPWTRPQVTSPGLVDRAKRLAELDESRFVECRQAVENSSVSEACDNLARELLAQLPRAVTIARPLVTPVAELVFELQPCLRDIWHGNLLFTGDEVTGIVDFGAMQIDSPALDVARLLGSMAGNDMEVWGHGLEAYEALRPFSPDERTSVRAADVSGVVLGSVNWLRWLYVERREFGDLTAVEGRMRSLATRMQGW